MCKARETRALMHMAKNLSLGEHFIANCLAFSHYYVLEKKFCLALLSQTLKEPKVQWRCNYLPSQDEL